MRVRPLAAAVAAVAVWAALVAAPALAGTGSYAPLDRPGPTLSVPTAKLKAALSCTAGIAGAARDPILLVPGTDLTAQTNYSWNYERALAALHWPYCAVTLPVDETGDIQIAGEYIVYALRTIARDSGRKVDVVGYSQGGMVPRWALRFWPDTRALVHDMIGIDPSNHGTLDANAACQQKCLPADWQQAEGSHFLNALNSGAETFAGIDYTVIFSRTDEVVVPNLDSSGSSSLHTGAGTIANIAVQQICPNDVSEHLAMGSYDPVAYALVIDALTHSGVADPARIPSTVCARPFQPGVDPAMFAANYATYLEQVGRAQSGDPMVPAEPPLACYVFAACKLSAPGGPPRAGCPKATGRLSGRRLGLVQLGMTRAQARRAFARSSDRGKRYEDFFCLTPIGVRVGYASPKLLRTLGPAERRRVRGRVVWASTANAFYSLGRVRPGMALSLARRRLALGRGFHVGLNWWYFAPHGSSHGLLKVRHGTVEEIGIAETAVTQGRRARRVFLTSFS
jgi:triacylglycerol esterase/lipase EstA (alpha/beta hydrolase family)